MQPKPENFGSYYPELFKNQQVVNAYRYRPPYPQEVFTILASLIVDEPRTVLDVGSGSGDIARPLVEFVERIDAVDFSQNMIDMGKQLPNGNHPHLHWIYGKVEEVPLTPPYALITAVLVFIGPIWKVSHFDASAVCPFFRLACFDLPQNIAYAVGRGNQKTSGTIF